MTGQLILASASPRRRELLERVGISLEIRPAEIDETPLPRETPAAYVARIADVKAFAIVRPAGRCVLAADTTVTIDNAILGKAASPDEAAAMLRRLSGRVHQVITAFVLAGDTGIHRESVTTDVEMIELDAPAIANYLASGEWLDKAGAYAIQGIAAAFVRAVHGSVTNVIGLPLAEVIEALHALELP